MRSTIHRVSGSSIQEQRWMTRASTDVQTPIAHQRGGQLRSAARRSPDTLGHSREGKAVKG